MGTRVAMGREDMACWGPWGSEGHGAVGTEQGSTTGNSAGVGMGGPICGCTKGTPSLGTAVPWVPLCHWCRQPSGTAILWAPLSLPRPHPLGPMWLKSHPLPEYPQPPGAAMGLAVPAPPVLPSPGCPRPPGTLCVGGRGTGTPRHDSGPLNLSTMGNVVREGVGAERGGCWERSGVGREGRGP